MLNFKNLLGDICECKADYTVDYRNSYAILYRYNNVLQYRFGRN